MQLCIVTGHSRGLGAALARQLLARGDHVLGIARQALPPAERLEQWACDLADPLPVARRLQGWLETQDAARVARVVLVNNAGMLSTPQPLREADPAELSTALRVGLESALLLCQAFLAATRSWHAPRRILNISSGLGRRAMAGSASYCAAKAGMDHLSRCIALEEAEQPNGARIVSLAPGVIETGMQRQLRAADPAGFPDRERFVALQRDGLLLTPEAAAANLVRWLEREDFGSEPVADVRD